MDPGGLLGMTRHSQPCKVWICLLFLGLGRHSLSLKHFPAPGLVVQVGLEPISHMCLGTEPEPGHRPQVRTP